MTACSRLHNGSNLLYSTGDLIVLLQNFSHENELDLHENKFMNGLTRWFILILRQEATRKWSIHGLITNTSDKYFLRFNLNEAIYYAIRPIVSGRFGEKEPTSYHLRISSSGYDNKFVKLFSLTQASSLLTKQNFLLGVLLLVEAKKARPLRLRSYSWVTLSG